MLSFLVQGKGCESLFNGLAVLGIYQGCESLSFMIFLDNAFQVSLQLVVDVGQILESSDYDSGQSHSVGKDPISSISLVLTCGVLQIKSLCFYEKFQSERVEIRNVIL